MKTILDTTTNEETTTYFGLWNKCEDKREGNTPGQPLKPLVKTCEPYGDGNMVAGFDHPPGEILNLRAFSLEIVYEIMKSGYLDYRHINPISNFFSLPWQNHHFIFSFNYLLLLHFVIVCVK